MLRGVRLLSFLQVCRKPEDKVAPSYHDNYGCQISVMVVVNSLDRQKTFTQQYDCLKTHGHTSSLVPAEHGRILLKGFRVKLLKQIRLFSDRFGGPAAMCISSESHPTQSLYQNITLNIICVSGEVTMNNKY